MNVRKRLTHVLIILVQINLEGVNAVAKDETLVAGATGCEVTKASIDRVKLSYIFKKSDYFIMARVAFCSEFGKKVSKGIGIWQLTAENLKAAQGKMGGGIEDQIKKILCIDFKNAKAEDLKKPLYSAVCAALLIEGAQEQVPFRSEEEEQRKFWQSVTSHDLGKKFQESCEAFKNKDKRTDCLKCDEQPTDLIFVVDNSGSIADKLAFNRVSLLFPFLFS